MIAISDVQWPYIIIAWLLMALILGGYVFATLRRGRELSKRVPEGKRRWM